LVRRSVAQLAHRLVVVGNHHIGLGAHPLGAGLGLAPVELGLEPGAVVAADSTRPGAIHRSSRLVGTVGVDYGQQGVAEGLAEAVALAFVQ
jgi:hypothetical protein